MSFVERVLAMKDSLRLFCRRIWKCDWLFCRGVFRSSWKCDQCGKIGCGDESAFFALEETDHCLEFRCNGSLRPHNPSPENKAAVLVPAVVPGVSVSPDLELRKLDFQMELLVRRIFCFLSPISGERMVVVGLGSTYVQGLSSANIRMQLQVIFRPERLVIPSSIAPDFLITDIKVGRNSQFVSSGAVPAVLFAESALGVRLKMDTAQISMFMMISVTNQNLHGKNFQGVLIGQSLGEEASYGMGGSAIADRELRRCVLGDGITADHKLRKLD